MADKSSNVVASVPTVSQSDIGSSVKVTSTPNVIFRTSSGDEPGVAGTQIMQHMLDSLSSSNHSSSNSATVVMPPPPVLSTTNGLSVSNANLQQQQKKTSFQITSVTVDSSASNDGGDDSADDLDESHTEDSQEMISDASRKTS